ncbi:beta strand repeat-containing protein, partial [Anaerobiospirillum succiniciproducens]|uniref:beta strand repeat-containing protein n=1 Tax=Anaerobiospirillum succiniciproducens TaxID=13335 RepID=UPI00146FB6C5
MKQTNNAIKFLMAQYRAIFKNANIAMVAAIAAAALAAGQAQAGTIDSWAKLETVTEADTVTISGSGSVAPNDKVFNITLTQAGNVIKTTDTSDAAIFSAKSGSITVKGNGAVLDIGSTSASGATVTLGAFAAKEGTVNITGSGDTTSTLSAGTITLGGESGKTAVIDIKAKGVLGVAEATDNTVATTTFDILEGGELKFSAAGGKVGAAGEGVNLNGGKITVDAAATDAEMDSSLKVTAGTVTLADAAGLTVNKGLTVSGGKVAVGSSAAATLTVKGNASFSGADALKIGNAAGKLVVNNGDVTFGEGSIAKDNAGIVEVTGIAENATKTITVQQGDWANLIKGKISGSGTNADSSVLKIDVQSTTDGKELDLANIISPASGTFANLDGGAKIELTNAKALIAADHVKFEQGTKYAAGSGILDAGTLTVGKNGAFSIDGGVVNVGNSLTVTEASSNANLSITKTGVLNLSAKGQSGSLSAKAVTVDAANNGDKALNIKGTWDTAANITVTKGVVSLNDATLNLTGTFEAKTATGSVVADNSTINTVGKGEFALSGNTLTLQNNARLKLDKLDLLKDKSGKLVLDESKFAQDSVIGGGNTTIALMDGNNKLSMKVEDFEALKTAFGTKFTGLFEVELSDILEGDSKPAEGMSLDKVVSNASTNAYNNTGVTVENGATPVKVSASVGNVHVKTGHDLTLDAGGALTLNKANANDQFVSKKSGDGTTLSNVTFKSEDNALVLGGTGAIGAIKTDSGAKGSLTIGSNTASGTVTVKGDVGASASEIKTVTVQKDNNLVVNGSVYTEALGVGEKGSINVGTSGDITTKSAKISGDVTANTLTISGAGSSTAPQANYFNGNSTIDVSKLVLGANNTLDIGKDKVGEDAGSFAHVYADTFVFEAGSSLFVDPEYGGPASLLAVQNITNDASKTDVQTLGGKAYIGKNAAMGIGFTDAEFGDLMADYLTVNGGFNENGDVKNALALNAPITIKDNNGIVINSEADRTALNGAFKGNQVTMEGKSALILTDKAFGEKKDKAAITFESTSSGSIAVTGTDSKVVLVGDFDESDTALKLAVYNGQTAATGMDNLVVEYAGGLLKGVYKNGTFALQFQPDQADAIYDGISRPVADAIVGKLRGQFKDKNAAGYGLLTNLIAAENYKAVDAAAHAATYAGAQQAAVAAVTTMADAMFGRVGAVGVEAASISATGSQANGGVWLTPMYKSVDSDGFNAEGASYGADVDLSGVAFGTDTVNGNMRFGAVFNIGSGDAEGKGNGNGLKDEFDYYGFGIYSAMGFGNFALVGDASMTVISHEVEG